MMCYGARDLARSFLTVRRNTIQIAEEIPESKLDFSPAPGTRTIRQLLTHIAMGDTFATIIHREKRSFQQINFTELAGQMMAEEQKPRSKAELIALLKERGHAFGAWLETLSEDFLGEALPQPPGAEPPAKTRHEMLMGVKEHEMHHRGQLMLIERMLGIVPHLTRQMQERFAARAAEQQRA